jgi:hypothetical protein
MNSTTKIFGVQALLLDTMKHLSLIVLLLLATPSYADYIVTGQIEGNVCHGIGIEWCEFHKIAAVKGDDGRLYEPKLHYESVTEFKESSGRCWIKTKQTGGGIISWGINAIKQPVFLERNSSGEYKELDVEYLVFKCVKR